MVRVSVIPGADHPLRVGAFELDVRMRELRRGKTRIRLQEQPFEILRMMLERPGHVVTREELQRRLWPDGTFVDFEHSLNAAVKRLRAALGDDADNPRYVETLPRRGYRFIAGLEDEPPARDAGRTLPRLAVLPFANMSDEGGQEYFTDGLTEEMIAQLGQLCRGRIGVIARWSCMVFKGTIERARVIGQALGADYLLEGSVRREGDRVRITVRLVETSDETQLWSESYERDLTDCLVVQSDVAARVAQSLAEQLMPGSQCVPVPTPTPLTRGALHGAAHLDAYQAYLKGRYEWNLPGDQGVERAFGHFRQAARLDPRFPPAHSGMARVYVARAETYRTMPRTSLEEARAAAKRALDLDPELFEGHLVIGDIRRMLEWDWNGAEQAYTYAIALNPSQENAHRGYARLLAALGRHEEAIREAERATELDPLCLIVGASAAWVRYMAGDYDVAIDHCHRTIGLDPQHLLARRILAAALLQAGRRSEALALFERLYREAPGDPVVVAWLAHARAVVGHRQGAEELIDLLSTIRGTYVSAYHVALAYAGLGYPDGAFASLEKATVDADPSLANIAIEPRLEPVRDDPRYRRILDLLGL
jgi:TolB-like protein/Tfp pilus assembly protein PilF